jgi:hypothetical protein
MQSERRRRRQSLDGAVWGWSEVVAVQMSGTRAGWDLFDDSEKPCVVRLIGEGARNHTDGPCFSRNCITFVQFWATVKAVFAAPNSGSKLYVRWQ